MSLSLHTLRSGPRKRRRRVGRGNASGRGTYAGRGLKGQRSRTGGRNKLKRRGLKQFLQQLPKSRGFHSRRSKAEVVNLGLIERCFDSGSLITPASLAEKGLISSPGTPVRILGQGKLSKRLTVKAHGFSESAAKAIHAAGGEAQRIVGP